MRTGHLLFISFILAAKLSFAQWISDPSVNNLIASDDTPLQTQMISDGSGGAIIVWANSLAEIYVQRINSSGQNMWPSPGSTVGIQVCSDSSLKLYPVLATDGNGGAIIAWGDARNSLLQLFAQKIDSAGIIQWDTNGVRVSTDENSNQLDNLIISDGNGGAIITWDDTRNLTGDIFAQKINSSGTVMWDTNGVEICTETGDQLYPDIAADGNGGAIITWEDYRDDEFSSQIYAQKVDLNGTVQWAANGIRYSNGIDQQNPYIIEDGSNGALLFWESYTGCGCSSDIFAQRIDPDGLELWTTWGTAIVDTTEEQSYISAITDGSGGAIVTWQDFRDSTTYDVYAQSINGAGVIQWAANGIPVIQAADDQMYPSIAGDGSGGAIISWETAPGCGCSVDIYAQRVDQNGSLLWAIDGVPVTTAVDNQSYSLLISDDNGGAISSWIDLRDYPDSRIFASRIQNDGVLPVELNSFTATPVNNSVVLNWSTSSEVNNYGFEVERQLSSKQYAAGNLSPNTWEKIGFVKGNGNSSTVNKYSFVDKSSISDTVYYRLKQLDADGKFKYSKEIKTAASIPINFTLYQNYPNPFNPSTKIKFDIPGSQGKLYPVRLTVYDILGNKIADLIDKELEAGNHEVEFNGYNSNASSLASGVYFAQLEWNGKKQMKKMLLQK